MTEQTLDCRGLACPSPVLKAKERIDGGGVDELTVLVDNSAASENVTRFLERFGFAVAVHQEGETFAVTGTRLGSGVACQPSARAETTARRKVLVLLGTDRLGRGDDELGRRLVANFVGTLKEMGQDLWRLILVNGGVKLSTESSEVLAPLAELESQGLKILVCGTCLSFFQLLDAKRVGETTNMLDIVTALQLADSVISLT
jgi:selenium metabolism protein YedF